MTVGSNTQVCGVCSGSGQVAMENTSFSVSCVNCGGLGELPIVANTKMCSVCSGSREKEGLTCPGCGGLGELPIVVAPTMRVYEPPKVTDLGTVEDLIRENVELKKSIHDLQNDNSRLVKERRGVDERYMVEHFHRLLDVPVLQEPQAPHESRVQLRASLIAEEFFELLRALGFKNGLIEMAESTVNEGLAHGALHVYPDLPEFADACADLKYVIVGSEIEFGIDGRSIFLGVHKANLEKVGGPVREDGKRLKPEGWQPFDVAAELRRQGWRGP